MRFAHLIRQPVAGSRYKYGEMFRRVCDMVDFPTHSTPRAISGCDAAIIYGDKSPDYKAAMAAGLPYILVQHDTASIRFDIGDDPNEREMIENAACILFTSETHADWMEARYTLPPYRIVHLRPFSRDLLFTPLPKKPDTVVYSGGIVSASNKDGGFGYRAYHPIFAALMAAGWDVHIYPAWNSEDREGDYAAIGCTVHKQVSQSDLYRELSQYTVGFQGYAETGPQCYVKGCRPNKLWEYLAAGIPTVGYNTGDGSKIYQGKWGTIARSLEALPAAAHRAAKIDVSSWRNSEVIDNDWEAFRDLVEIATRAVIEKPGVETVPQPPLDYPVKLGKDIPWFQGKPWVRGQMIDETTAIAMKQAGHLTDPRIPVGCLSTEQTAEAVRQ